MEKKVALIFSNLQLKKKVNININIHMSLDRSS